MGPRPDDPSVCAREVSLRGQRSDTRCAQPDRRPRAGFPSGPDGRSRCADRPYEHPV